MVQSVVFSPFLSVQIVEETLEVGQKKIFVAESLAFGDQLRKLDVADHVVALLAPVLLGDALEMENS